MGDEDARTAATPIFAEGRPEAEVAVPRCRPKSGWNPLVINGLSLESALTVKREREFQSSPPSNAIG